MTATHPLIAAALAAPKTHKCVTVYDDGTTKEHLTRSEASATTHADFVERPKIGRTLLSRETGEPVSMVVDVYVARI